MERKITQQDGADAVAMLDRAKTADELRNGDVTTMVAAEVAKARVLDREDAIKAKQAAERKATKQAAVKASKTPAKRARTPRAQKVASPKARTSASADPMTRELAAVKAMKSAPSKAQRVRALLDEGKTVREIAQALDDVTWSYAWDVAAAWEKRTGRTVIPSHAKTAKSKKARSRRTSASAGMPRDAAKETTYAPASQEGVDR